jgi:uncharacterized protein
VLVRPGRSGQVAAMTASFSAPFTRIAVFCKQPVPGRVKTRLAAVLGPAAACAVYEVLLRHTLSVVLDSGLPTVLCVDPPESVPWFAERCPWARIVPQCHGDLGERLSHASGCLQADGSALILIGSDCPGLSAGHLREAGLLLHDTPVVLGPSLDGGYWLLGLQRPVPALFASMPWSQKDLLKETHARLRSLGIPCMELPTLRDLDDAEDLLAAKSEHPTLGWP